MRHGANRITRVRRKRDIKTTQSWDVICGDFEHQRRSFMRVAVFLIAVMVWGVVAGSANAQHPVQKNGSCPSGYYASGDYCVPTQHAKEVVPKSGSCPSGYYASGNYCLATDHARSAIPKHGACPSGYYASGNYCLQAR